VEAAVSIRVRAGHESDAPDLARTHYEAVRGTAAVIYPSEVLEAWAPEPSDTRAEAFRRALAGGDELFVVAEQEGRVVGFGSLVVSGAELRSVYVAPSAGRRGIGSRLLAELERLAVERGIETLHVVASLNAEKFYTSHGYESVQRAIHRVGGRARMACLRMQKSLWSGAASLGMDAADCQASSHDVAEHTPTLPDKVVHGAR
jgi:putative acetyltransferase